MGRQYTIDRINQRRYALSQGDASYIASLLAFFKKGLNVGSVNNNIFHYLNMFDSSEVKIAFSHFYR